MQLVESSRIKFISTGKDVADAFAKVKSVVSYVKADDGKFVLAVIGEKSYAIGTSTDAMACIEIKGGVGQQEGVIGVDVDALIGTIKGRKEMLFYGDSKLHIEEQKGKYKVALEIRNFDDKDIKLLQQYMTPTKSKAIAPETIACIRKGVKLVELQNFYSDEELVVLIDVKAQRVGVSCYDNYHVADYVAKHNSNVETRMAILSKAFTLIDKFMAGGKAKFETATGRLRIAGPEFLISIPETQVDESMYGVVPVYMKMLKGLEPVTSFNFDLNAVNSVQNMSAVVGNDTKMLMTVQNNVVGIEVSTERGSVSDQFAAEVEGKDLIVHIDPRVFMDLFKKVKERRKVPIRLFRIRGAASAFVFSNKTENDRLTLIGTFDEHRKED